MYLKVYLLLVHKNPNQVNRLVQLLDDGKSVFFVHVDKKSKLAEFNKVQEVNFVKNRVRCNWGGFSLVKATINSFAEIVEFMEKVHPETNYHCILLSGEDLPLKKNKEIHDLLKIKQDYSFINYWKLPYAGWWDGGMFRFTNLYLLRYKYSNLNRWINKVIWKLKLQSLIPLNQIQKKFPDLSLYGGQQWMILNSSSLESLVYFYNQNPKVNALFKYVLAPDEIYFSTTILNYLKDDFLIENVSTHFVIFQENEANSKYLEVKDLQEVKGDFPLFARKFDDSVNEPAILHLLEQIEE